ncbi:hypothetical protein [Pedobacter mendelii]|uniref:Uncharacterized protein n=1 Tax=Pedobacter mendelii TaxID=1908240 RepID=A0ABQ2BM70_9SPHI|nr:hypothetical protein [Pedobacter mendelii]GGI27731.1 hypothetical protein GCM10008119_29110 [Pedobacter mendelii]
MKSDFKYVLICFFVAMLLLKITGIVSAFIVSIKNTEYNIANQDSGEKEEKKIEPEYFDNQSFSVQHIKIPVVLKDKEAFQTNNDLLSYFPEVLTPPPSRIS